MFSDTYPSRSQMSPTASRAPGLHIADIGAEHTTLLGFSEGRQIPGGGHATTDDSFIKHDSYFFKDGNVTFLVGGTLYCVHRYFFSRDSVYFSTRFAQLGIRNHEALPIIISIGDIERKDFDALLSVLYPTNFEAHELTYEQWKSVLHLSTRWGFTSLRKLSLKSIKPPTPYDQFVLARAYSVDHWVLPALTALCERSWPLFLDEARQMSMEDVVLVARVREEIRGGALRVDPADIRRHIEVVQAGKLRHLMGDDIHRDAPKKEATAQKSDSMVASAVDPNVEAAIAEMTGVVLPSGLQHRGTREGEMSKELPVESPGVELPGALESSPQDCLKKNVAKSAVQTGGTRKLEAALPKEAASPLAKAALAENHALRTMAQEAEEKANAETMRHLEAEAAKERADAEEKSHKVQEEAVRARERTFAEVKKAAVEAEARVKYEAEFRTKVEAAVNVNEGVKEEVKIKAVEEAKAATAKAKVEEERKRVEAFEAAKAELRAMQAEQIERQRAADRAARAAAAASGTMASAQGSWFSKIASVAASAIPKEGPTPPPTSVNLWNSDPWSKRPVKNAPSPSTVGLLGGHGGPGIPLQHPSTTSSTPRGSAPTHSTTSIMASPSSASVVSFSPTLVWQERKPINDKQDAKAGDRKGNEATAAPPAWAAADVPNEPKSETVMAIADKTVPSQTTNASKTCDIFRGTAAPNALGDKYASPAPTSCTYRSTRTQETPPAEVVADLKPNNDHTTSPQLKPCQPGLVPLPLPPLHHPCLVSGSLPLPPPRHPGLVPVDFPPQTPGQSHLFPSRIPPETDATVTKEHDPSPESVASASAKRNGEPETSNVPDAKNAGETSAQIKALFAAAQDSGVKPDGATVEPMLRPSQHSEAGGWGPAIMMGGNAHPKGPTKSPHLDYIREVGTASTMSTSSPGMPADDAQSSSFDKDDGFDASGAKAAKLTKKEKMILKRRARKQAQMGEENSPRASSGATSNSVDKTVVHEPKPVATVPLGTYSHRKGRRCPCGCEGESGEDDADVPVIVEKLDAAAAPAEKVFDDASDDAEWLW